MIIEGAAIPFDEWPTSDKLALASLIVTIIGVILVIPEFRDIEHLVKFIGFLLFSFIYGNLWIFVVITYFKKRKRGNKFLTPWYGKIAVGAGWFMTVMIVIYLLKFRTINFDIGHVLDIFVTTIAWAIFLQISIFFLVTKFWKEKHHG